MISCDLALDCVEHAGLGFNYPECPVKITSYLLYEHIPIISYFYGVWLIFLVLSPFIISSLVAFFLSCFKYTKRVKKYDKHNKPTGDYILKTVTTRNDIGRKIKKEKFTIEIFRDSLRDQ